MSIDKESDFGATGLHHNVDSNSRETGVKTAVPCKTQFRWRVVFAALLAIFALASLLAFSCHFALAVRVLVEGTLPAASARSVIAGDILGILGATSLVLTATNLKKGRWRRVTLFCAVAAVLGYIACLLGGGR